MKCDTVMAIRVAVLVGLSVGYLAHPSAVVAGTATATTLAMTSADEAVAILPATAISHGSLFQIRVGL